ncbi:MAG: TIGR01906 family membrane protein [Chloroflexi bacterium]|nr:TIGR01906 family membrane protein [Chloroflexota bacterium]
MTQTLTQRVAPFLVALCAAIVLIVSPLHVLFRPSYARYQYARGGFPASSRFTPDERARLSDTILRYMEGSAALEEMASMETDNGSTALRPSEVEHLVDVKAVVRGLYVTQAVALAVGALAFGILLRGHAQHLATGIRVGVGLTAGLLVTIGAAAAVDFDRFFTIFHGVFFEAGTWTFFYEDTLIQLYPLPFWVSAVTHLLILIAALGVLLLGLAGIIASRSRRVEAT